MYSDFGPTANWKMLEFRAQVLKRLRAFFDERGFVEVETPVLSHDTVIDQHLDPIPVTLFADPREPARGPTLYLQTSPEFGMKRLLAAGDAKAIYQITRAFRGAEVGAQHNPEFTMLEWYQVGDDYHAGMKLLQALTHEMFDADEVPLLSYCEAFERLVGVNPMQPNLADFQAAAARLELAPPESMSFPSQWIDWLQSFVVQPELGREAPVILFDFPAAQAALAQTRDGCAERFELFYQGVELANGYHELLDPAIFQQRNATTNSLRQGEGKPSLPEQSRLLAAMQHGLPPCSGCALGVDRLVMVLAGASNIQDVMAFPLDRA